MLVDSECLQHLMITTIISCFQIRITLREKPSQLFCLSVTWFDSWELTGAAHFLGRQHLRWPEGCMQNKASPESCCHDVETLMNTCPNVPRTPLSTAAITCKICVKCPVPPFSVPTLLMSSYLRLNFSICCLIGRHLIMQPS